MWLAPAGALAYCLAQSWSMLVDLGPLAPLHVFAVQVFAAPVVGVITLAARGRVTFAVALTVGIQAATPVEIGWHDGCNGHAGEVPAIAAPYVLLAEPESPPAYSDSQTAMGCF